MTDDQGIFSRAITWLFGANWRTSLSGYVAIATAIIHEKPQIIAWIPEPTKGVIWNVSEYIFIGAVGSFVIRAKDKSVSGGTIQQDSTGAIAKPQEQLPPPPEAAIPNQKT